MISGALLLNPQREIGFSKIKSYISRMLIVLLTFGIGYALMELVFNEKTISLNMLLQAFVNTAQGETWNHMWYIYALIALYIVTIPLKCFINSQPRKNIKILLAVLFVGNFIIPTLNLVFDTSFKDYMMLNEYATYYILGYYLSACDEKKIGYKSIILFIVSSLLMITSETISLCLYDSCLELNQPYNGILVFVQSVSLFVFIKHRCNSKEIQITKLVKAISYCSFGIYLIHPFWINLLYKLIGITPLSMPIGIGIVVLFVGVLALSMASALIVKKIPLIKNIL